MLISKILTGIWMGVAGFTIGLINLINLCPLSVAYMIAVCMGRKNIVITYIGTLIGIAVSVNDISIIRYAIILLGIAVVLKGQRKYIQGLFAGMIYLGVNLSIAIAFPEQLSVYAAVIEVIIALSVAVIYSKALAVINDDGMSVATEQTAAVSVMVFGASILFGTPFYVGNYVIAAPLAMFSILCVLYKFGMGIGLTWCTLAGMILSYNGGNTMYMTAWIPVVVISYGIIELLHGKRLLMAFTFLLCYEICGIFFYGELLNEDGYKTLFSALLLFLFMPAGIFLKMDRRIRDGELNDASPEWGRLVLDKINSLSGAFKRIDYTLAYNGPGSGIGFRDVGNLIDDFTNKLDNAVPLKRTIEAKLLEEFASYDMEIKNLSVLRDNNDRLEVFITARIRRGRLLAADVVRKIVEKHVGVPFVLNDESRNIVGRRYEVICMHQKAQYSCIATARGLCKYAEDISGDNFLIDEIGGEQKAVIIADGMGNGEKASRDSMILIDSMEELLNAGFDRDMSIRLVNGFLADKNKGEHFATLDMLLVDQYTGCASMYKHGAATTYIKRGDWLEMIKSTSLPVGVIDGAICESCSKKLYENDLVIMMSDGMTESIIVDNKDDFMRDVIMGIDSDDVDEIAEEIVTVVKNQSGNRLRDDATIIVVKLVKTL